MLTEKERSEMSFWDHTKELVLRLRRIVCSVVIVTIVVMVLPISLDFSNFSAGNLFYPTIASSTILHLQERFLSAEAELLPLDVLAPLEVYIFVSLILGIIASIPVISYELYKFLNPAFYKNERRGILKFTIAFSGLFAVGFALGYLFIIPLSMKTLFSFSNLLNLTPTYAFNEFMSLVGLSLLVCGIIFTLPIFLILLVKAGILETKSVTGNRKYLYGSLIIIIAILDPDPGLVTESLVFLPLVLITEISLLVAKRIEKNREISNDST